MQRMFLLQIQSPWKQNFSLSMLYLWARGFFLADVFLYPLWMVCRWWMLLERAAFFSLLWNAISFFCAEHHIPPWNKGSTFQQDSKISGSIRCLFSSEGSKNQKCTWCIGKNFYKKVLRLSEAAQVPSDVEIAMVTVSAFRSKKSHKTCAAV